MYRFRASFDVLDGAFSYWGLETAYAVGRIDGHSGMGVRLKSHFSDFDFECRLGYTFQGTTGCCAQLTPFVGYGYFIEKNHYIHPSPLKFSI